MLLKFSLEVQGSPTYALIRTLTASVPLRLIGNRATIAPSKKYRKIELLGQLQK